MTTVPFLLLILAYPMCSIASWNKLSLDNINVILQSLSSQEQLNNRLVSKQWDNSFNHNHPDVINTTIYIERIITTEEHLNDSTVSRIRVIS